MMLNFLRFLAAHGIDPEWPLILGGMVMGACLIVIRYEIQKKRVERRRGEKTKKL